MHQCLYVVSVKRGLPSTYCLKSWSSISAQTILANHSPDVAPRGRVTDRPWLERLRDFDISFQVIDNYVGGRGLISEKEANGSTVSNIYVASATIQDTGNYTCEAPALAANASVNLHVHVDGKFFNASAG